MKRSGAAFVLAGIVLLPGCSQESGPGTDPVKRMFESSYGAFVADAGAHRATCELALKAKGDGGKRNDAMKTLVEVDETGSFRIERDDFELVHVGSIAWQRTDPKAPLKRTESGARPELLRDAAAAPWRALLEPFAERVKLERTGSKRLGDREVDVFAVALDAGGGADGGPTAEAGTGTVELDAVTGWPVAFTFEGGWEAAAPGGAVRGRVSYTVDTLACAVTLGDVNKIEPPEKVGPPPVKLAEAATPTPAASAAATAKPKPAPTKKKGAPR